MIAEFFPFINAFNSLLLEVRLSKFSETALIVIVAERLGQFGKSLFCCSTFKSVVSHFYDQQDSRPAIARYWRSLFPYERKSKENQTKEIYANF